MSIAISCPECGKGFHVAEDLVGRHARCPKCLTVFTVESSLPDFTAQAAAWPPPKAEPPRPPELPSRVEPEQPVEPIIISLSCPKCGSDQTQRVSVIVQSGTTTATSRTQGGALAFGNDNSITPILTGGKTREIQTTALAKRFAPPEAPLDELGELWSEGCLRTACLIATVFAAFVVGPIIGLVFGEVASRAVGELAGSVVSIVFVGLGFFATLYVGLKLLAKVPKAPGDGSSSKLRNDLRQSMYETAMKAWRSKCFCHRCGHVFIP